jgi:retron-type reverse transcriptase
MKMKAVSGNMKLRK